MGALGMGPASNGDRILYETTDSPSIVLVQGSSGSKGSGTGEYGKQGSKSDQPTSGKQNFGTDQPQSGDFHPNPSASTKTPEGTQDKGAEKGAVKSGGSQEQHGSSHPPDSRKK